MNNYLAGGVTSDGKISNPIYGDGILNTWAKTDNGSDFFQSLIPNIVGLLLTAGVVIFFFMLIIGGIQWISSGGDKQGLEAARGKFTSAIVGLTILFTTFALISLIENFFGVRILTLDIGSLIIQ